ncbi:putative quinol monooxygenase [Streptosporangium sp. CA-115845]|uniref:putative quinol monooxygenase n=1 Tax=Streptosporangium sp. CA-115845 TaxID=3240071 RepID=UPI003D944215
MRGLAGCILDDVIEQARAASGCLGFVPAADSEEPDRINAYERWESDAHLERFRGTGPEPDRRAAIRDARMAKHGVAMGAAAIPTAVPMVLGMSRACSRRARFSSVSALRSARSGQRDQVSVIRTERSAAVATTTPRPHRSGTEPDGSR